MILIFEHFNELKIRVGYVLLSVMFTFVVGLFFWQELLFILVEPLQCSLDRFIFTNIPEAFLVTLRVSLTFAILLNIPTVMYHFWLFLAPAMYREERKEFSTICMLVLLLSLLAIAVSYYILLPYILHYFLGYQIAEQDLRVEVEPRIGEYINVILKLFFFDILLFQLPLVIYVVHKFYILLQLSSLEEVARMRPLLYVIVLFASTLIAPPDVVSQVVIVSPVLVLYELYLFLSFFYRKKEH